MVFSISGAVERGERGWRTEGEAADSRARAAAGGRSSRARWRDPQRHWAHLASTAHGPGPVVLGHCRFSVTLRVVLLRVACGLAETEYSETRPCLIHPKTKNFLRFSVISNLTAHTWSIKYSWKQKLITQFACKSRDESFKPSYFMIG